MIFPLLVRKIKLILGLLAFLVLSIYVLCWSAGQFDDLKTPTHNQKLPYAEHSPRKDIVSPLDLKTIYNLTLRPEPRVDEPKAVSNLIQRRNDSQVKDLSKKGPLMLTLGFGRGRTGNSMFQYASLLGIARALQRTPFVSPGWILDSTFQLRHVLEIPETKKWQIVNEVDFGIYNETLFNLPEQNITIRGYLQSWKYFHHIKEEIKKEFTFRNSTKSKVDAILKDVRKNNMQDVLVGVHVRRGDFLTSSLASNGYSVARKSFFFKAFDWFRSKFPDKKVLFLVVSDDFPWCKANLAGSDVKLMPMASAPVHLGLLAHSDHVILTGGTFGWWGAWLAGGHAVYYDNYPARGSPLMKHFNAQDYYPPNWVGLGD